MNCDTADPVFRLYGGKQDLFFRGIRIQIVKK